MENKKDIGKAISDKLNSLDKTPKEQVWTGISYELQKKKKRRFGFFFFWSRVVGLVLFGAMAGLYIYHQNGGFTLGSSSNSKESITINNSNGKTVSNSSNDKNQEIKNNGTTIKNGVSTDDENATESKNNISKKNNIYKKNAAGKVNSANSKTENASSKASRKSNSNSTYSKSGKNKKHLFSKSNSKKAGKNWVKRSKRKSKKGKGNLGVAKTNPANNNAELIDLSSLQSKNSGDLTSEVKAKKTDSIAKEEKEKMMTLKMFPKDSIKKDSIPIVSYKKFDVDVFITPDYYVNVNKSPIIMDVSDTISRKSVTKFGYGIGFTYNLSNKISFRIGYSRINLHYTNVFPTYSLEVTQKMSYTEIPFEFKYMFLDKKIRLKTSVGFSYLILRKNNLTLKAFDGYEENFGENPDLNKSSFSLNMGFELDYPLFKNTKIFVEPMLNYQIKAFSESDFKPYLFGIHTGIRYSFNNK